MKIPSLILALLLVASLPAFAAKGGKKHKIPAVKIDEKGKFTALDTNHDGAIDAAELAAYEKAVDGTAGKDGKKPDEKQVAELNKELEDEFKRLDANHDGKLTQDEELK